MSQDPNLFSAFKRTRETLGAMDRNNIYVSGIPQPASAMKRSNSGSGNTAARPPSLNFHGRPSLMASRGGGSLQRTSSGSNLADMPTTHLNPKLSGLSSRKSFAPGSTAGLMNRRSSVFSHRPSMGGALGGGNSFFAPTAQSALAGAGGNKPQDPRPLRDRNYLARISQQLTEFLLRNNFELEAKHSLGPNAMKSPTQKDFVAMFQWLYHRIDPHYKFTKAIDHEAIIVLKNLRYPYIGNITKSQLGAAGGPHWPTYLAMLHWLMELGQTMEEFESGEYDYALDEAGFDMFNDRVSFRYLSRCYGAWLNSNDDHQEFYEEMAAEFEARSAKNREEKEILEAEHQRLEQELNDLQGDDEQSPLERQKKINDTVISDIEKFRAFIEVTVEKIPGLTQSIENLEKEYAADQEEIKRLEAEKKQLQEAIDKQGLTPVDVDRMNAEREKLTKALESTSAHLETLQRQALDAESEVIKKLEHVELAVKRFNELEYKIGLASVSASGKSYSMEIIPVKRAADVDLDGESNVEDEKLLYDVGTGYTPSQILNLDVRNEVRPVLNKYRSDITARIHAAQDACFKTKDYIDTVKEAMEDKREELATLEASLKAAMDEYNEIKETMTNETAISNVEMEKLSSLMMEMRLNQDKGVAYVDQALQAALIEQDQITHAIQTLREHFHGEVEKLLNEVVKFKLHIQEWLGIWDGDVAEEFDKFIAERKAII